MPYFLSRRRPANTRRNCAQRPRLEALEVRSLLSGAGSLDPTFGSGGIVTTALGAGGNSTAYALSLQTNGDIVAAGSSANKNGINQFAAARYTPAGALDTTFGNGGSVAVSFFSNANAGALAEAIDSSGRIVLAGYADTNPLGIEVAVTRLNANGSLDTTFGNKGKVVIASGYEADAMLIQPDGKIVVAGFKGPGTGILARLNPNGTLDNSFGNGGVVTTTLGLSGAVFRAVALQGDGKIVVGGCVSPPSAPNSLLVARFNANGTVDTSFGSGGLVSTSIAGVASTHNGFTGVLVQSNGLIVASGSVTDATTGREEVALARYNVGVSGQSDGSLDANFGSGGITVTPAPSGQDDVANAAALQADGSIVVGGNRGSLFLVERYTSAGALDTAFNGTGIVTTTIGSDAFAYAMAIQPTDGKIVAAGRAYLTPTGEFALARYLGAATTTTLALSPVMALEPAPTDAPAAFVVTPLTPTAADAAPGDMLGSWLPMAFAAGKRSRA